MHTDNIYRGREFQIGITLTKKECLWANNCFKITDEGDGGRVRMEGENIIMPRCTCASEVYGSVCVTVCVDCYSCSRINEVQVRVSI